MPPGKDTAPPPDCWRRGRSHAERDDAASYSTGISLLIRPRSIPCRRRMTRATMYLLAIVLYVAARIIRKRQGIDLGLINKEIPVE